MRVCFFGTYEANYDRNRVLIRGLRAVGVEVHECHVRVWERIRHKTLDLRHPLRLAYLILSLLKGYTTLIGRYLTSPRHDIVWVGYLGHFDVLPAWILNRLRRKPMVFDAFVSLYDTLVEDRAVVRRGSLQAAALKLVDRWTCNLSDLVLLDTNCHIDYFCETFGIERAKFERVLVGADDEVYGAAGVERRRHREEFTVFHHGKFAPLHGIPYILEAADLLRRETHIKFKIVGDGQTFEASKSYAEQLGLENLVFTTWLSPHDLNAAIRNADVCLGIFGATAKATRVIPNKVYQYLAAGAAVVTGRSPAAAELLVDGEHALLCEMASGRALADAILELERSEPLRERLRVHAAELFVQRCTPSRIAGDLLPRLERLLR